MYTLLERARSALWAIQRGMRGWFHSFHHHHGSPAALRGWLKVWWELRPGRRQIVELENQMGVRDRWRP